MSDFILDVGHVICCCSAVSAADRQRLWKLIQLLIHSVGNVSALFVESCCYSARHVLWIPKVTGSIFAGLCFACLGHEACCRSRLSEASHRGILLGVGSNPAAVRAFRMGSFTAPWHVCGRFGLGTTFGSSTAFGVAVYWFRTQPRSEGAGHKKCLWIPKVTGSIFSGLCFWLA